MKAKVFLMLALAYLQVGATNLAEMALSRGSKNNNPLNLVHDPSNRWVGLTGHDGRFCCFDSVQHGFRAAFIVLHRYMVEHGLDTVEKIITRWAPPLENCTSDYIQYVCREIGREKNARLRFVATDLCPLVAVMTRVECGMVYDDAIIREAFEAAEAYVAQH